MKCSKHFLVADDHFIIRMSLEMVIHELFMDAEVYQANTIEETKELISANEIDYTIIDVNFPQGNSLKLVKELAEDNPNIKILVFTAYEEDSMALHYLRQGACGFLSKRSTEEEIRNAINSMVIKGKYITQELQEKILDSYLSNKPLNPIEILSNRELEVARLLVQGHRNLEISNELDIKQNTISTLKSRIFEKLEISNLPDLISIFRFYNDGVYRT